MELRAGGLKRIIKPSAEVVVSSTRVWVAEERGDLRGDMRIMEEREGRVLRGDERGGDCSKGRKRLDG